MIQVLALAAALVLAQDSKSSYLIQIKLVDAPASISSQTKETTVPKELMSPSILVQEGQPANVGVGGRTPFVTAIETTPQGKKPVITVLEDGMTIEICVKSIDQNRVSYDITVQNSTIQDVQNQYADDDGDAVQSPTVETIRMRKIGQAQIGEKNKISCGRGAKRFVEFVIHSQEDTAQARK